MMELAAAMATMPKKSGTRPMGGQSAYSAPRPPMGMATRPPVIANKARGTMASHFRQNIKNALPQAAAYFNSTR
jgi:hypothetical protein